jgi:hypothetical protein
MRRRIAPAPTWARPCSSWTDGGHAVVAGGPVLYMMRIYAGEMLLPTASPLPFFAYPFPVATLLGWAWVLVREQS